MSDEKLEELAKAAGLAVDWIDAFDQPQRVDPDNLRYVLDGLGYPADSAAEINEGLQRLKEEQSASFLPPLLTTEQSQGLDLSRHFPAGAAFELELEDEGRLKGRLSETGQLTLEAPIGYHQLHIKDRSLTLAVAPSSAPTVATLTNKGRAWGLTAQLYSLRRPGDGGLGDLKACEQLIVQAAAAGADALSISPIHAMFSSDGNRYSPYSPSSRLFHNVLHCAPENLFGQAAVDKAIRDSSLAGELQRLESLELIDWPAAGAAKLKLLQALFKDFSASQSLLHQEFANFRRKAGEALENHCRFEALYLMQSKLSQDYDWHNWPDDYRDAYNPQVREFARTHSDEIDFHAFCQWLISHDLERTQKAARDAGMGIGLIADLAVGADGTGSQAWSRQDEILGDLTVGAPPDVLNRSGQSWGISGFSPTGLKRNGYRAFIEMLRANLAHAGGLRIDHIMGLYRLWVIPQGAESEDGAYLHYPFQDLLRLVTLEAARHQAVILGEDLGTVPGDFRQQLIQRNLLGMRVLLFQQDDHSHRFRAPHEWDATALATTTTHDLPTIAGWWQGNDIEWRARIGQTDEETRVIEHERRAHERHGLATALTEQGLLAGGVEGPVEAVVDGAAAFIGRTPAPLALLPVEDALGLTEQANLPGDVDKHPNWRRRLPVDSDKLLNEEAPRRRLALLEAARRQSEGAGD